MLVKQVLEAKLLQSEKTQTAVRHGVFVANHLTGLIVITLVSLLFD